MDKANAMVRFVQTHLGDHKRDVNDLDATERGVYESLRMAYFEKEGPLPLELKKLYILAGASDAKERKAVDSVLEQKFEKREDGFFSERCAEELKRIHGKMAQASKAAQAKWDKAKRIGHIVKDLVGDADASAEHMRADMREACQPLTINQQPLTNKQTTIYKEPISTTSSEFQNEEEATLNNLSPSSLTDSGVFPAPQTKPEEVAGIDSSAKSKAPAPPILSQNTNDFGAVDIPQPEAHSAAALVHSTPDPSEWLGVVAERIGEHDQWEALGYPTENAFMEAAYRCKVSTLPADEQAAAMARHLKDSSAKVLFPVLPKAGGVTALPEAPNIFGCKADYVEWMSIHEQGLRPINATQEEACHA